MKLDAEIMDKISMQKDTLDRVKTYLENSGVSDILYDKVNDDVQKVDDVAVIQCFYGTDIRRIRATTQAIEFNLQMTRRPSSWLFIESQIKKSDCVFSWLKNYGVNYIFVPMSAENNGIMLKTSLWNIGAANCKETNLCFLDSDVVMCNSNWVENCIKAFSLGKDVISLASHQYYQLDETCKLYETIGYKWQTSNVVKGGHCGFTIGMTRAMFNELGGFDPAIILDDINIFHKIIGDDLFASFDEWSFPMTISKHKNYGFNCQLGYAENVACHIWHGDCKSKYSDITTLLKNSGLNSASDILDVSDKKNLPTWNAGKQRNQAIKNVILRYQRYLSLDDDVKMRRRFDIMDEYYSELGHLFGEPNENHPLFVCTVVNDGFDLQLQNFIDFKNKIESEFLNCNVSPQILFFTNCKKFDFSSVGITTVPLKKHMEDSEFIHYVETGVEYPENSIVYYIPF